jgi:hypothetical protein
MYIYILVLHCERSLLFVFEILVFNFKCILEFVETLGWCENKTEQGIICTKSYCQRNGRNVSILLNVFMK